MISNMKWLSGRQICRMTKVNAGATKESLKNTPNLRWSKVYLISSILKNVCQLSNLHHWRQVNENSKNVITPDLSNLSWKKGGLAGSKGASHCEMARKWECQNLLNYHLASFWSWKGYIIPHLKEEVLGSELIHSNSYLQAYFWVTLGSTKCRLHFGLSVSHLMEEGKLLYPIWKRIPRASIWLKTALASKGLSESASVIALSSLICNEWRALCGVPANMILSREFR